MRNGSCERDGQALVNGGHFLTPNAALVNTKPLSTPQKNLTNLNL